LSATFDGVQQLRQQVDLASAVDGASPGLDLSVPGSTPAASRPDGLAPVRADVLDARGDYIGELLLWLRDGRLDSVEYAWITDEPPSQLPELAQLRLVTEEGKT
jgi:hypothetical protein